VLIIGLFYGLPSIPLIAHKSSILIEYLHNRAAGPWKMSFKNRYILASRLLRCMLPYYHYFYWNLLLYYMLLLRTSVCFYISRKLYQGKKQAIASLSLLESAKHAYESHQLLVEALINARRR